MSMFEIVIDRFVSDGLWEFCLKDLLDKHAGEQLSIQVVRLVHECADNGTVPERLVVCETEAQAKKLAEYLSLNMTQEQFERVICLEGYEGEHYFEKCLRSLQPLEKSLDQICDLIYKPAVVNLDYCDFWSMVRGTENWIVSMSGSGEQVMTAWEKFLNEVRLNGCMVHLTGDVSMVYASDFMDKISDCGDALIGVDVKQEECGEIEAMIIYR